EKVTHRPRARNNGQPVPGTAGTDHTERERSLSRRKKTTFACERSSPWPSCDRSKLPPQTPGRSGGTPKVSPVSRSNRCKPFSHAALPPSISFRPLGRKRRRLTHGQDTVLRDAFDVTSSQSCTTTEQGAARQRLSGENSRTPTRSRSP